MKTKITAVMLILIICLAMARPATANQSLYNVHNQQQKTLCVQEDYSFIECYRLNIFNNGYNNEIKPNPYIQDKTLFNSDTCIIGKKFFSNCPYSENMEYN